MSKLDGVKRLKSPCHFMLSLSNCGNQYFFSSITKQLQISLKLHAIISGTLIIILIGGLPSSMEEGTNAEEEAIPLENSHWLQIMVLNRGPESWKTSKSPWCGRVLWPLRSHKVCLLLCLGNGRDFTQTQSRVIPVYCISAPWCHRAERWRNWGPFTGTA